MPTIEYSQSHVHNMIQPFLPKNHELRNLRPRQTTKFEDKMYLRMVITQKLAYWIKDNAFYVADVIDGEVQRDTARQVDIMAMDKVELDKMMLIIEKLTEEI